MPPKNNDLSTTRKVLMQVANAARHEGLDAMQGQTKLVYGRQGSTATRGICRYLKVSIWRSESMYQLPRDANVRLLYLYLLTGPHTLSCHVPGLYQVGRESLREELRLNAAQFNRALSGLTTRLMVQTDFGRALVWAPSALDHMGPPANPNIVTSYCRALLQMPKSPLVQLAIDAYRPFLANLGAIFAKPFEDCFPLVLPTVALGSETVSNQGRDRFAKEKEKEREEEKAGQGDGQPSPQSNQRAAEGDARWQHALRHAKEIHDSIA